MKLELLDEFINYLENEKKYSSNTCESYKKDLMDFLSFVNKDINSIDKSDIDSYILYNIHKLKETSINRKLSSIRSFYKYLSLFKNYVNVSDEVEFMKKKDRLPVYLTTEEVNRLLNINLINKFDYRNKAMLELLYTSGLRATELISLDLSNIDFENKILNVYGKGKKERIVPLNDIAIIYLRLYIYEYRNSLFVKGKKRCDALFLNNHGERITRHGLNLLLNKIAQNVNINKNITPHVLRHSFATHLVENGADIRTVQELLGHENVITTEVYTHIANNYISDNYFEYFNRSKKEVK